MLCGFPQSGKAYVYMKNFKIYFIFIILILLCISQTVYADEFSDIRLKWYDFLIGGEADKTDINIKNKIDNTAASAYYHWDRMKKQSDRTYLFDNYQDSGTNPSQITGMYELLSIMATAYRTNGSFLYNNQALKSDIINAMDWLYLNSYNENITAYGNWWEWEIGAPSKLNNLIIIMYDDLSQSQIENYTNAIEKFTPDPTICCYPYTFTATAANRLSLCFVVGLRGIIVKDSAKISAARDALSDAFLYSEGGDGFYRDGSFIQHDKHPYNGAYGLGMINDLSSLLYLYDNTLWEITDTNKNNIYDWIYNGYLPLIHNGIMMDIVTGRAVSRSYNASYCVETIVKTVVLLSKISDDASLKSIAKRWIRINPLNNIYTDEKVFILSLINEIMNDSTIIESDILSQNKQYPNMDRVSHIRTDFKFALSMCSSRIYNYESILDENTLGYHSADGMTYLYNNDLKQYTDNFWPTINKKRLPGTTVSTKAKISAEGAQSLSNKNQVGGVSLSGIYGSAVMDLNPYNSTLEAKKSWFMFDDEIVALGAGITCSDNNLVETIIDNRMLSADRTNIFTINDETALTGIYNNVNYMHLEGNTDGADIGYYIPDNNTINILNETRFGSWAEINGTAPSTIYTRNYLNIWINHNTDPVNANYAYVLLPGKSAIDTKNYASNPQIEILSNNSVSQAVYHKALKIIGVNFLTDNITKIGGVTSNKKASVMMRELDDSIEISLSDPTQANSGTIELEIEKTASDILEMPENVTILSLKPTIRLIVNVKNTKGQTITIKLDTRKINSKTKSIAKIDNFAKLNILNGEGTIRELGSVVFKMWAVSANSDTNPRITGSVINNGSISEISFKQPVTSMYKDHIMLSHGTKFSETRQTVIDIKYKVSLENYAAINKPTANFNLYIKDVSEWVTGSQKTVPMEPDVWQTIKLIVDPLQKKVFCSNNGAAFTYVNFKSESFSNMNDVRLYMVSAYPTSNPSIDDDITYLETPINWIFDYINVYETDNLFSLNSLTTKSAGSELLFSADIENHLILPQDSVLIVAVYDGTKLISLKNYAVNNSSHGDFITQNDSINIEGLENENLTIKAFLWNNIEILTPFDTNLEVFQQIWH